MIKLAEVIIETTNGHYLHLYRLFNVPKSGEYNDANFKAEMTDVALTQYPDCYIHGFNMLDTIVTD